MELLDGQKALRFLSGRLWAAWVYPSHVLTVLPDGRQVRGAPPEDAAFVQSAHDLGYGDDTYWHIVEHDLLHSIVAEELEGRISRSIAAQANDARAHEGPIPLAAQREEDTVGALQAALNGLPWAYPRLRRFEVPPHLVGHAVAVLRTPEPMTAAWAGRI